MLREERRLRVFENRGLSGIFGPKRDAVTGSGEKYIMTSLVISIPHPILCGYKIEMNEMGGACRAY